MLNITSHQETVNLNHNDILLHTFQDGNYEGGKKKKGVDKMWRNWKFYALLVGMENGIPALQNIRIFLKEIKIDLPYNPAIPYLDFYPKYMKLGSQRDISTPVFTATLFIIPKKIKNKNKTWMSIDR